MLWVIEHDVFPSAHVDLGAAAAVVGHAVRLWKSEWDGDAIPSMPAPVVFHGSLGNAVRIVNESNWSPGAFCDIAALTYSNWADEARPWLLNQTWRVLPLAELVESARLGKIQWDSFFARPDSPLKQFSGRVLKRDTLTMKDFDFGLYFDDPRLPVVIAPQRAIGREWRYVVIGQKVVAGSGYDPSPQGTGRKGILDDGPNAVASEIAQSLTEAGDVYVMDLCESQGEIRLVELNPFSGADLYRCDGQAICEAMAEHVGQQ
jgi:ATP-grasp domain, R2K clade family 3